MQAPKPFIDDRSSKIQPDCADHGKSAKRVARQQAQSKALLRKPLTKTSKAKSNA
ncbi:hypothetical protein ACDI35_06160 [Xanthomonas axonopodis pv. cajani]|uniref:hypothetical protein n=1 Tax=Xanthomonas axonopodis TaxID=53413 RepID=UPI0035563FFD